MVSVKARAFSDAFSATLAKGGRFSDKDLAALEKSAAALTVRAEKEAAEAVLALVEHDKILDKKELAPAKTALAKLLGTSTEKLPAELQAVLKHAVPVPNVRVADYDLSFDFSKDAPAFPATAVITLEKKAPKRTVLEIDPARITVNKITAGGEELAFSTASGRLVVDNISGKELTIQYTVKPTDDVKGYGLIRDRHAGRMWTLTWPYNTGALFPSSSRPDDGATARVTVRVKAGEEAVGAGAKTDGSYFWKGSVPAYAVSFTTGKHTDNGEKSVGDHTVRTVGLGKSMSKELRRDVRDVVAGSLDFFTKWLGPVPFGDHVNIVEIKSDYGGMEHAGAIAIAVGQTRHDTLESAVHETAHHWFGDGVRIAHWGELWMSEGFTNYATFRYFRHKDGEEAFYGYLDAAKDTLREQIDDEKKVAPLTEHNHVDPTAGLTWVPYMHGAWMLRMLECKHGTEKMDALLGAWHRDKHGDSVTTKDFIAFAKKNGVDCASFFAAWQKLEKIPAAKDQSTVKDQTATLKLKATTKWPEQTAVPVVVKGTKGETATFHVVPGEAQKVDVGFKIRSLSWDPERTLLADVA